MANVMHVDGIKDGLLNPIRVSTALILSMGVAVDTVSDFVVYAVT